MTHMRSLETKGSLKEIRKANSLYSREYKKRGGITISNVIPSEPHWHPISSRRKATP